MNTESMRPGRLPVRVATVLIIIVVALVSNAPPASALTPNEKYVTKLYQDFLGRAPSSGELAWGTGYLGGGGSKVTQAQNLMTSQEFRDGYVNLVYRFYLTRDATSSEVTAASSALQTSGNYVSTEADVLATAEYLDYVENSVDEFVGALYRDILFREGTSTERSYYATQIVNATKTRRQVAAIILRSSEAARRRVNGYASAAFCAATSFDDSDSLQSGTYCIVLDRLATTTEVSPWETWWTGGGQIPTGLWPQLVNTTEYWTLSQV